MHYAVSRCYSPRVNTTSQNSFVCASSVRAWPFGYAPEWYQGPWLGRSAFTLIEMMVVLAITGFLIVLAGPMINSLQNSRGLTQAAGDMQGIFEQARAYAIANNT